MDKDQLYKNIGRIVSIVLNDGQIHIGQLGYAPKYCSRLGLMMPDSFYIGEFNFKPEQVRLCSIIDD